MIADNNTVSTEGAHKATPAPFWLKVAAAVIRRMPFGRFRLMNALPRRRPNFLARLSSACGGPQFVCHLGDSIAREVCYTGQYEPAETLLLHRTLRPGSVFVDVGANWGYFTLLACGLVGPTGRVVSFEPDARLFSLLKQNRELNGFGQATVLPVAASDRTGQLKLQGFSEADGNWGLSRISTDAAGPNTFSVEARAVDDVLDEQRVDEVDLLKMDIEGAERLALQGISRGLARRRYRAILLELHPSMLRDAGCLVDQAIAPLVDAGYTAERIDHSDRAVRDAAYGRVRSIEELLSPMTELSELDLWPHLLWTAPQ